MNKFGLSIVSVLISLLAISCNTATDTIAKPTNTPATPDANQFLTLINQFRSQPQTCKNGAADENMPAVGPVTLSDQLNTSARLHSEDMANNNYFEHTGLNGSSFSQRNTAAGYTGTSMGENLAAGSNSEQAALDNWRNSTDGHCQGLMQANATEIGIGYGFNAQSEWRHYWTFVSGRK